MSALKEAYECGCRDHLHAAGAGHVQCLQRLEKVGLFLGLGDPGREEAGEARKTQAWEAAHAACGADRSVVLKWIFAGGWPPLGDAVPPWNKRTKQDWKFSDADLGRPEDGLRLPNVVVSQYEYLLYRCAVRCHTPACLEVLLDAGCRSELLCVIAADAGNLERLQLATSRECPCGLWAMWAAARAGSHSCLQLAWDKWRQSEGALEQQGDVKINILCIVHKAALQGHAKCLELLWEWFGAKYAVDFEQFAVAGAAHAGHIKCLQAMHRRGVLIEHSWKLAASAAASQGHLDCIEYLLEQFPEVSGFKTDLLRSAAEGRCMDALKYLHEVGCPWSGEELREAAGDPEVLRFCLQHVQPGDAQHWDLVMEDAVRVNSHRSMEMLYNHGYDKHRSQDIGRKHPAVLACLGSNLECLKFAVTVSSAPDPKYLCTVHPAAVGEAMLQYVRDLGAKFQCQTAKTAARHGKAGALQYALENGAPFNISAFRSAVAQAESTGERLDCLRCLLQHASVAGFPPEYLNGDGTGALVKSLAKLVFLNENCPSWAPSVMTATVQHLENTTQRLVDAGQSEKDRIPEYVDWRMVVYLGRHLVPPLPPLLEMMVAFRRERAIALANAFFQARKLSKKKPVSDLERLWNVMERLPGELRQRIAAEAQLIVAWQDPRPEEPGALTRFTDVD
eukprot:jgi/Botrbrau1/3754/Bobra.0363s0031.1